jgi:hypothetical protein
MAAKSVFISSTSKDLQTYRDAANASIRRLELCPIDMQDFGSQPGGASGVSLREVGKADLFIAFLPIATDICQMVRIVP